MEATAAMTLRQFMKLVERVSDGLTALEARAEAGAKKAAELEARSHDRKNEAIRDEHEARQLKAEFDHLAKVSHRTGGFYYQMKTGLQDFIEAHGLDPDEPFTVTQPTPDVATKESMATPPVAPAPQTPPPRKPRGGVR